MPTPKSKSTRGDAAFVSHIVKRTPLTRETVEQALRAANGDRELCRRAVAYGVSREVHPVRLIQWLGTFHLRDFALCDADLAPRGMPNLQPNHS